MSIFFKGVGVGTFLYGKPLRAQGIIAQSPTSTDDEFAIMMHVANGTVASPYISLTSSYAVAYDYAINWSHSTPTAGSPAYVYMIDLKGFSSRLRDPVRAMIPKLGSLLTVPYHHDGGPRLVLSEVAPKRYGHLRFQVPRRAPLSGGVSGVTRSPAKFPTELATMLRALRDAEMLVTKRVPGRCVIKRFPVY